MFERILAAIDGSENSSRAADTAIDLAKRNDAALFLVTVVHNPVYAYSEQGAPIQQRRRLCRGEHGRQATEIEHFPSLSRDKFDPAIRFCDRRVGQAFVDVGASYWLPIR